MTGTTPVQMLSGYAKAGKVIQLGGILAHDDFRHIDHAD
jgi:hypothetical protein